MIHVGQMVHLCSQKVHNCVELKKDEVIVLDIAIKDSPQVDNNTVYKNRLNVIVFIH